MEALLGARLPRRGRGVLLVADARLADQPASPPGPVPARRRRPRSERTLPLEGYEGPAQYGSATWRSSSASSTSTATCCRQRGSSPQAGHGIDREFGDRLAAIADLVTEIWREPDAGIWEVRGAPGTSRSRRCSAGSRSIGRAGSPTNGYIPAASRRSWRTAADEIETFIEDALLVLRKWAATHRRRRAKTWTRACCWALDSATAIRRVPAFRDTIDAFAAISGRSRSCIATAATTALRGRGGRLPLLFVLAGGGRSLMTGRPTEANERWTS